nr:zinc finger, CCHC-type [Tanacetum cinerariifolium]
MRTTVVLVPSNKKPKLECWKCGKTGHFKRDCQSGKKNNANAGGLGKGFKDQSQDQGQNLVPIWNRFIKYSISLISEAFYVQVDAFAWWIDSGATTHVCKDRYWFKTHEPVEDESVLYMGDDHFALVHGKGSVALEFSSKKTITLFNVLYVPKLRKNLVFGPMLNKCGYKQVYESDKYILSKSGAFVGFGYYNNGMFMLNLNKVPDDSDFVYMSSSTAVNSSLWHARLGHGCRVVVRLPDPKRKTLGEKVIDCIFVGYAEHFKAYRFYIIEPNDSVSINSFIESRDTIFDENRFSLIPRPKDIIPNSDESQRDDHSDDVPNEILEPRKVLRRILETIMKLCNLKILLFGKKQLTMRLIFKRKMKVNGTVDKFKARLVIQGFRQKERIDYFDTYAPLARITTIRLLLALAAIHNLVIYQMDVKTAFLNGNLDEEVYMKQPEGFVMPVDKTKKFLSSRFSMKDMGEADVILGIKIKRENKGIAITQSHYIERILKKFNRKDFSPVSTPMDPVENLKTNTRKPVDQLEYSKAIGYLMYAMTSTRPDIAYVFGRLSRFTSNPSRQHWKAITRVFKYLRGTKDYGLSYVGYPSVLEAYSDASWINHVEDSSSRSRWVFLLGGGAISWASKKQTCITGSTMESEFVELATAGKEAE